jgi:hypothetical protein
MLTKLTSVLKVVRFSWGYSLQVAGQRIWLLFFYTAYKSIHPILNAYFLKLAIDNLLLRNIALIFQ